MNKNQEFVESIKHGGMHSFFKRALELGVKVKPLKTQPKVIKLSHGDKAIYVRTGSIPGYKMMGHFTKNKSITKAILNDVGISVPKGIILRKKSDFKKTIINKYKLKYPLIVKPQDSSRAKGVTWNVRNIAEVEKAISKASRESKYPILIEEMFIGDEYRILVFNNRVAAAVLKMPPTIYGDGKTTITELIDTYNGPRKTEQHLKIDAEVKAWIKSYGYNLKSIPKKGEKIKLKNTFLMSEGARLISANKNMGKYYKDICLKAVSTLNSQIGGVDLLAKNISKPSPYVIIEVNGNPYFNMHEKELIEGQAVDIAALILFDLFPQLKNDIKTHDKDKRVR